MLVFFSIIMLFVILFGGMAFFLRHMLTRNVTHATAHLQEMIRDNSEKQEEIAEKIAKAQKEYEDTISRTQKEVVDIKEKAEKDIDEKRNAVLEEAYRQSEEIISRAHKTAEAIQAEMDTLLAARAAQKAAELIPRVLPEPLREQLHQTWITALLQGGLTGLERLRLPEDLHAIEVVSAFEMRGAQLTDLKAIIEKKLDRQIELTAVIDPGLVAGIVMRLGTVVFDGSFGRKLLEIAQEGLNEEN